MLTTSHAVESQDRINIWNGPCFETLACSETRTAIDQQKTPEAAPKAIRLAAE
jgi:hypothetical protein